jgi:hypothetical protein
LSWTASIFVLGNLLSGWAFDRLWPWIRFPDLYYNLAYLEAQPAVPTVVCLGSSRFGSLVNAQVMTRWLQQLTRDRRAWVFNASVTGGDALSSEGMLREMLHRGVRPQYALIEMCPPAIAEHNPWPDGFMRRQLQWSDIPTHAADLARQDQLLRLIQVRLLPLYGYRERICIEASRACARWWMSGEKPVESTGTTPVAATTATNGAVAPLDWHKIIVKAPVEDDRREVSQRALPYLSRVMRNYHPGGTLVAALERIMALCRENSIEPILVGVPVTSSFRQAVTPAMEASYRAFLSQFCQRYHCTFVDYYAALPDNLFLDYHHATGEGAEEFGYLLTSDVFAPLSRPLVLR